MLRSVGRALVVSPRAGPGAGLALRREVPVRSPGVGEIVVRVDACAVAYRDVLDRTGAFPFIKDDAVIGHEIAGTVVDVGENHQGAEGAHGLETGDRVVVIQKVGTTSVVKVVTVDGV